MRFVRTTRIPGLLFYASNVYADKRGHFIESFRESDTKGEAVGSLEFKDKRFVQDNESYSLQHVLRGLHFQQNHPQDKLVRVAIGRIFDVVVDLRTDSQTFGQWLGFELWSPHFSGSINRLVTPPTHEALFVPAGCAHGFLTLSAYAVVQYKCTEYYYPQDQCGICWNDPDLNITWDKYCSSKDVIVSEQDSAWPNWAHIREELLNVRRPDQESKMP